MTFPCLPRLALPLLFLLFPNPIPAATPQRIPLGSSPSVEIPDLGSPGGRLGDQLYFTASDPLHGRELWLTDGSALGTRRVTDLCPGACSASFELLPAGERLFLLTQQYSLYSFYSFTTVYEVEGEETRVVTRFPGFLKQAAAAGGEHFFDIVEQPERSLPFAEILYRSNGEPGDLRVAETICERADGLCVYTRLETVNGALYYLKDGYLRRLAAGGVPHDVLPLDSFRLGPALPDGRFLLQGCSDHEGCLFYSSDGSSAFALLPEDASLQSSSGVAWNGQVYWIGGSGQLVRSDGTAEGTWILGIAADGLLGATPGHLFYYRRSEAAPEIHLRALASDGTDVELLAFDRLAPKVVGILGESIFLAGDGDSLHVSDGTSAGTRLLDQMTRDGEPGVALGDRLYVEAYAGDAPSYRSGLWSFDAQGHGQPFILGSAPLGDRTEPFALAGGSLIASLPQAQPTELWRVDPQTLAAAPIPDSDDLEPLLAAGDRLLAKDRAYPHHYFGITPAFSEELDVHPSSNIAASPDGKFYWGVAGLGQKLWESDGTAAGTRVLADFSPGWAHVPGCNRHCAPEHPSSLLVAGDAVYLVAAAEPVLYSEPAVWVYRRSSGTATRLKTFHETTYSQALTFFPVAGGAVFELEEELEEGGTDRGLWFTDGTVAGTRKIFTPPAGESRFVWLAAAGERVFFVEYGNPSRLWVSDLTPEGTFLALDRRDLTIDSGEAAVLGDRFFFVATTNDLGRELWTSDGTAAGTRALDLRAGPLGSNPDSLLAAGGRLLLAADRGASHGHELYQSDGTLEGTVLMADIAPGPEPSSPSAFVAAGNRLFFSADDGNGRGLWALDLPARSTRRPRRR